MFFDAEHFFDGYKRNPEFALRVLEAAAIDGADCLVLCDTNGGSLPHEVERIVGETTSYFEGVPVGMHIHNDTGCAVANALAGVLAGATQVQGTINGYGERTGNCDLITIIPNLTLKMGIETLPPERMERLTSVAHHVAELCNIAPMPGQPYVGKSAFAHKAGLHTVRHRPPARRLRARRRPTWSATAPASGVGAVRSVDARAQGRGDRPRARRAGAATVVDTLKRLEHEGFHFEAADASLELLMRRAAGWEQPLLRGRVVPRRGRTTPRYRQPGLEQHRRRARDRRRHPAAGRRRAPQAVGEGNGPVNALDDALRNAPSAGFPALDAST